MVAYIQRVWIIFIKAIKKDGFFHFNIMEIGWKSVKPFLGKKVSPLIDIINALYFNI